MVHVVEVALAIAVDVEIEVFVAVPVIVAIAVDVFVGRTEVLDGDGGTTVEVTVGGTTVLVGAIVEVAIPVGDGITVAVEVSANVPRTT